jgi:TonB family protein
MRIALVGLLLAAQTAAAQSPPDAAALLKREATALDAFATFSYEEDATTSSSVGGVAVEQQMITLVTGTSAGQRRMEARMGTTVLTLSVTDGHELLIYMPMLNQYMRITDAANAGAAVASSALGISGVANAGAALEQAAPRVLRSEFVSLDGMDHDCWVIERRSDTVAMGPMTMRNVVDIAWIDKALGVALRRTLSMQLQGGPMPGPADVKTETRRRALMLNSPVEPSLFIFTPPAGAKEVSTFSIGLPAAFGGARQAAPSGPRRGTPMAANAPQAFVPSLQPIEAIEPEWPDEARARNVQGSVDVLLTIDAQGAVVDTEVLTGPAILRAAATSTARQLRFHPVIRNGQPVAAYTLHDVLFFDRQHPNLKADVQGVTAMADRQMALERAWPRTPAQVLADYENDLEGREPFMRQAMLPQVANAAMAAGAMDTAERYAHEMLDSTAGHGPIDGSAIHDGHVVLGLAALSRGDLEAAKQHLLDAGHTSGSPVLNSFGPNLSLAQKLLDAGARDTVLEYLRLCEKFWTMGQSRLQDWIAAIEAGRTPTLAMTIVGPGV